jgi:hypothetical protein
VTLSAPLRGECNGCGGLGLLMPTWLCEQCDADEIEAAMRELAALEAQHESEGGIMMTDGQLRARQSFEYHLARLRIATRLGAPRVTLDWLASRCDVLLAAVGAGDTDVARYRADLGKAKARVTR